MMPDRERRGSMRPGGTGTDPAPAPAPAGARHPSLELKVQLVPMCRSMVVRSTALHEQAAARDSQLCVTRVRASPAIARLVT